MSEISFLELFSLALAEALTEREHDTMPNCVYQQMGNKQAKSKVEIPFLLDLTEQEDAAQLSHQ